MYQFIGEWLVKGFLLGAGFTMAMVFVITVVDRWGK